MPGVPEQVDISEHSVTFTHNVAQYYHAKNNKCFEEYFEYNIINRLYCQELRGNMELDEHNIKFEEVAEEYAWFYLAFIKTLRFLKEHRKDKEFDNKYPDIDVQATFKFSKKEDRYLAHFIKFAKWCSHFAKDKEQYVKILTEDYNNHNEYKNEIQQYEN